MYRKCFKRCLDVLLAFLALLMLMPVLLILALWIWLSDGCPVFFMQERVGKNEKNFYLLKFRTMRRNASSSGLLTVGSKDSRITRSGYYLRKYKLDELPQLINVLRGEMSWVGPRPEVRKYVDLYNDEQKKVLSILPGITDRASITYFNESELLKQSSDPEYTYIHEIMPAKLNMNLEYIQKISFTEDITILWKTFIRIFKKQGK